MHNAYQSYTTDLSFEQFSSNFMAVEACLYNFQVIGEAVSHLPEDVKNDNPEIPWALIKGMRNRLIHEYFGTDLELVWEVIQGELSILKNGLKKIYAALTAENR